MNDRKIIGTIDAVRESRLALLQKPGMLADLRRAIRKVDSPESALVLTTMLDEDLHALRERGITVPDEAPARSLRDWRRVRCPNCDARPANALQAAQQFCGTCNAYMPGPD